MVFYRARYLSVGTGRFLSEDPISLRRHSLYSYVESSPLNLTDPSGMQALPKPQPGVPVIEPISPAPIPWWGWAARVPGWFWCLVLMQEGHDNRPPGRVVPFPTPQPTPECCQPTPAPRPTPTPPLDAQCWLQLRECLKFAGTDPFKSQMCMEDFKKCRERLGLPPNL